MRVGCCGGFITNSLITIVVEEAVGMIGVTVVGFEIIFPLDDSTIVFLELGVTSSHSSLDLFLFSAESEEESSLSVEELFPPLSSSSEEESVGE